MLLRARGHHAPHTHARGWLSSALHIELADAPPDAAADDRAGWIAFGAPPPELKLDLAATRAIRPAAGKLILFPSTTWHHTAAFTRGERLSVAFDVKQAGEA